ncbi:disease resistance protein RGA2 isoform X2 [Brachypodium distachyon]|uniref:NB-ARC domain-containing protein n=1 Tax=Brachypodium distachyon TaxID=15368 RepID=A0A2K2D2M3_BRADI|nr:disease resistance protein RGA2 isoform X2 [Brachypodium distachyon]PNT68530.1 hypothetical protein BRADI_3g41960v3 [Brachypodium distachyon]PNT68531.1 hypothetical protein BRADI_3g41960v3 [Brachypodium distachyon]PNT68533.1 hypothetical protein BRADI_3g41960v3 [Brachypodium distachyon]|eukprot:XP_010235366.1 disease resistance protein RGA2 isoform X2 [Brachypodium distachyon]
MADLLLLPVVRTAAGKAADAVVRRMTGMWGIDDDRLKLERQLLAVQCKLADAEIKSETNQYIRRWMKDFRTVAYEANDVLDGFQYEALRREARIGESKTRKVLNQFTSRSPLLFRLTMSRDLNNVLEKINNLVEEMNKFGLVEHAEPPQLICRQTHSGLDDSADIFGRDDDKGVVLKLLLGQHNQRKVQVLPIFGMGGLGKTTLAKMVYNNHRVQQHFQLTMWHCVSENFEAVAVVKSIIELATKGRCELPDTVELLRVRLQEVIGQKRYMLVLDDVWNEEVRKWEDELKPLLCSVGGPGSVILVTCRSRQVASIMGTVGLHELPCLREDDSWELFSKKAFSRGVEEQAELVTIGKRIAKKCRGLPLALKIMGGLMSSKQQVQEWEAIAESNIGDNIGGKYEILPILKLSYRHLSAEMKQCFAFCAVFAKDYEMEKDILIQLWMANGFIQEEGTMDLAQKGEYIFYDLVWRSFLQDVKVNLRRFIATSYESIGCKMHDLMHDLAKDVAHGCVTIEELIQQKASIQHVRHMWIDAQYELKPNSRVFKGMTSLHTLLAPSKSHKDLMEVKGMPLRALHCYSSSIIHSPVRHAKHLRYLDLSWSDIFTLPDSISVLYNLQTLRLDGCSKLQHLPEAGYGIEELKDLCQLGNRLELYNLRKIRSGQNAKKASLHQKHNLSELLLCWGRRKSYEPGEEFCNEEVLVSLTPHSKLKVLEVYGYGGLEISHLMGDPQMFRCLRKFYISNCPRCKTLPIVWISMSLEYLSVANMGNLTTLWKSIKAEAEGYSTLLQFFPKLKEIVLDELPILERWAENCAGEPNSLVMFPLLEKLTIIKCPKLASVPGSPVLKDLFIKECCSLPISSLAHLRTLIYLAYDGTGPVSTSMSLGSWPSLVNLEVTSLATMMMVPLEDRQNQSQIPLEALRSLTLNGPNCFAKTPVLSKLHHVLWECFAFVEELKIFGCGELVRWPVEELQSLAHLRYLAISLCDNLKGKGSSSEETLPLPQLERLHIEGCISLLEIPKLLPSLEQLAISSCMNLEALPSNLGDLAKLRELSLHSCEGLKVLPDGMDGLTSLEKLAIGYCPRIEKLPEGLLQQLPALKCLCILGCPNLGQRCREGGEYSHLVSSIPDKVIRLEEYRVTSTQKEPNTKKFLRRLLPSCGADYNN